MTITGGGAGIVLEGRGSHTITSAGTSFSASLTISAFGGTYTLVDALSHTSAGTLQVTNGTFTDAGFSIATRSWNSSNTNVRTLNLTGTMTNTGTSANHVMSTITNLTQNMTGSTLIFSDTSASAKTLSGSSGLVLGRLSIVGGGSGIVSINSSNNFVSMDIAGPKTVTFQNGTTQTVTGRVSIVGSAGNIVTINSSTPASAATLSSSFYMNQSNFLSVQDITVAGTAKWYAGWNSTNVSNNSGWQLNAGTTAFNSAGGFFG
jgi:hypothetical protein